MNQKEIRRVAVTIDFLFSESQNQGEMENACVEFFKQFLEDFPEIVEYMEDHIPDKSSWLEKMGLSSFDISVSKVRKAKS